MTDLAPLWEPLDIGPVTLPNRIFSSAHQTMLSDGPLIGERFIAYFAARAAGGAGLVVPGSEAVHPSAGLPMYVQAWREEAVPGHRALAEAVHRHGGRVFPQLWHPGHQSSGANGTQVLPVFAPSAVPTARGGRVPQVMEAEDIASVVAGFGRTAELLRDAGVDGVEISGGHGYLICEFLSPMTNRRTDGYGGGPEERCRFALEVGAAVRRKVGPDFPVGFRMVFDEHVGPGGIEPADAVRTLRVLHAAGLFDYFSLSAGNYHSIHRQIPPATSGLRAPLLEHAALARDVVGAGFPIMVANSVFDVATAAEVLAAGGADMVAMTRAQIADPQLVAKARAGRQDEIRRCVGANQGCLRRLLSGRPMGCTVNPAVGREAEVAALAPATPSRVLVIGGGPAGLKAAESAARRGHTVTLLERAGELGGQLAVARRLPLLAHWGRLVDDLAASAGRLGVTVRLGVDATPELVEAHEADAVVLATGARFDRDGWSPGRPSVAGIAGAAGAGAAMVLDPVAAIRDLARVGARVTIADEHGDLLGLALALALAESGRDVHLVTRAPFAGAVAAETLDLPYVLPRLLEAGVRISPGAFVDAVGDGTVTIAGEVLPADTLVVHGLRHADDALHGRLGGGVARIGDCLAPRDVDDAVLDGERWGQQVGTFALVADGPGAP